MSETDAILAASTVRANAKTDQISGIPPRPLGVFRIGDVIDNGHRIKFRFTTLDTKLSGYTICYVGRVKILKKAGANNPSANPNDGTVVLDAIRHRDYGFEQYKDVQYDDTDVVEGQTYTYTAYVYSDHNICNIQEPSIQSIEVKANPDPFSEINIWGFHQQFSNINAESSIQYNWQGDEYGVVNSHYDRAMTNVFNLSFYEKDKITLGSWQYFLSEVLGNHMYEVDPFSGEAISKVLNDEHEYAETEEGTDLSSGSHILMPWLNCIYFREVYDTESDSIRYVFQNRERYFSYVAGRSVYFTDPVSYEFFDSVEKAKWYPVGFVDFNNDILKGIWLPGAYIDSNSTIVNTGSLATTPMQSKTWLEYKQIIDNLGDKRCTFFGSPMVEILRDLEYMIFKTTNIQKACSYGNCSGGLNNMRTNRIDAGFLDFNDYHFISGFGQAKYKSQASIVNKVSTGFMFHSMVLGTYNQGLYDPFVLFSSYGYGSLTHNYELDTSGTNYRGTIYVGGNGGVQDGSPLYSRYFQQYLSDGTMPSVIKHDAVPVDSGDPFLSTYQGSTETALCDVVKRNGSGGLWCQVNIGSCDLGEASGPAYVDFRIQNANASQYNGASTLVLPRPGYSPNN